MKNQSIFIKTIALRLLLWRDRIFEVCIQKVDLVSAFSLMLINYIIEESLYAKFYFMFSHDSSQPNNLGHICFCVPSPMTLIPS